MVRRKTYLRTKEEPLVFLAPLELFTKKDFLGRDPSHVCSSMREEKLLSQMKPTFWELQYP